jgi:hypothetical protein
MLTAARPAAQPRPSAEARHEGPAYHKTLVRSGYQPGETR